MNKLKKVLLIINPCAGQNRKRVSAEDFIENFPADEYEFTVKHTEKAGHATELVNEFGNEHDIILCAGGDGTLNETINGVMDMANRKPIGYIPMGSTNDFATTLGLSSKNAADIIKSGHMNWYDIGLFNNRYFEYVASFGAFTRASYSTPQKWKNLFGHAAYIAVGVSQLNEIKPMHMRIEYDDNVIEDDFYFGAIANSTSVAGVFKFDLDAVRLDDGVFEILLIRKLRNFIDIPLLLAKVRSKKYDGDQIIFARANSVKITSDKPVAWTLDGEDGGKHTQIVVNNLCRAIKICSPENKLFSVAVEDEKENA